MTSWFSAIKADPYFLTEIHPYTKKRTLRPGMGKKVLAFLSITTVVVIIFIGESPEQKANAEITASPAHEPLQSHDRPPSQSTGTNSQYSDMYLTRLSPGEPRNTTPQSDVSQIVRRAGTHADADKLPTGTTIPATLANTVLSSDSDSPVIALITEDIAWQNTTIIPSGTKALGQASLDEITKRLKTRFHSLVFPDGHQYPLNALALLEDGSSGIPGDYHSGRFQKHSGKFLGNFVGGFAQGLKEKQSDGQFGMTHEPGTLKNGILNGLTTSSLEYANETSEDMKDVHPYLEVPSGTKFIIYLEREFSHE